MMDVETQTDYRDGETQTSSFDLLVPEPWQLATPNPWILDGCVVGFNEKDDTVAPEQTQRYVPDLLFARGKEKVSVKMASFIHSTTGKDPDILTSEFLDKHHMVLEPFISLSLDGLQDLYPCVAFKSKVGSLFSSTKNVTDEATSLGFNWLARLSQGLQKRSATAESRSSLTEQTQNAPSSKSNRRFYATYLGKHRRILTPRCDPLLVGRMERANAAVLLQSCLRGRAAQISMAQARSRILELYPELNELDDAPIQMPKYVDEPEELVAVKTVVAEQLYAFFSSLLTTH